MAHRLKLNNLAERYKQVKWEQLTNDEQTIKIVLDLAKIDIDDFVTKGGTAEGRTVRSFDKRAASSYLSKQFRDLWTQKKVQFHIEIDGPTLNILAEDDAVGMPVRLHRRSSGFRWHVSFAWKFTHASKGLYQGCILLLEERGFTCIILDNVICWRYLSVSRTRTRSCIRHTSPRCRSGVPRAYSYRRE